MPEISKLIEHRSLPHGEIRAIEANGVHYVQLQVIKYDVVDDYGSVWVRGCFDESLNQRMPTLCWAHDWSDILGRGTEWESAMDGPVVKFRLDDFEAVPRARQGYAQVLSGTIDDCSVGFSNVSRRPPTDAEKELYPGCTEIIEKADLDETSLVLRGAVPGAKVVGLRSKRYIRSAVGEVDEELFFKLVKGVQAGDLTKEQARIALELATIEEDEPKEEEVVEEEPEEEEVEVAQEDSHEFDEAVAEAQAIIERLN